MNKIKMFLIDSLGFQCSSCEYHNNLEYNKGDTKISCEHCGKDYDINIVDDFRCY